MVDRSTEINNTITSLKNESVKYSAAESVASLHSYLAISWHMIPRSGKLLL